MSRKDVMSLALLVATVLLMTAKTIAKCDFTKDILGETEDPLELPDIPDFNEEF